MEPKKKGMTLVAKQKAAIPGAGICNDCNYELFPDGKGIYHFFTDW